MKPLRGRVHAQAEPSDDRDARNKENNDRDGAHEVVRRHFHAVRFTRPVPLAHEKHVQIQEDTGHRREIEKAGEADDAAAEILEVVEHPQRLHGARETFAENPRHGLDEDTDADEERSENEGDGDVGREL